MLRKVYLEKEIEYKLHIHIQNDVYLLQKETKPEEHILFSQCVLYLYLLSIFILEKSLLLSSS